jgi:hypothetical protein
VQQRNHAGIDGVHLDVLVVGRLLLDSLKQLVVRLARTNADDDTCQHGFRRLFGLAWLVRLVWLAWLVWLVWLAWLVLQVRLVWLVWLVRLVWLVWLVWLVRHDVQATILANMPAVGKGMIDWSVWFRLVGMVESVRLITSWQTHMTIAWMSGFNCLNWFKMV